MRKISKVLLLAIVVLMMFQLLSCSKVNDKFDDYYVKVSVVKQRYLVGDIVTISIIEKKGSPQGYRVYQKHDDGDFELRATITAKQSFSIVFEQTGLFTVKIIPVLNGVEFQAKKEILEFEIIPGDEILLEDIVILNNIIDLYYDSIKPNTFLLNDLEVVYYPSDATNKQLSFPMLTFDNVAISDIGSQNSVYAIQAIGYNAEDAPYVIPIYNEKNPQAIANLYVRVKIDDSVKDLTAFYVGYPNKNYYHNDWVSFQCIEHANMKKANAYAVYRITNGVETLVTQASGNLQMDSYGNGNPVYKVKVTEPEGIMALRFYAIIDGVESDVFYDVEVKLSDPIVYATNIIVDPDEITLLLDQSYDIQYTVIPVDTFDKSVTYEIVGDGGDYIEIEDGVVTPKAPTDEPVKIKIISNSNNDVFAYLEVNVLDFRESDIDISYSKPLEQTIGSLEDIVFTVSGLNGHSCKWYVDGVFAGHNNTEFTYSFDDVEYAREIVVRVVIEMLEESCSVTREFEIKLNSAFEIEGLFDEYQVNSEVEFDYSTDLEDTAVIWRIERASGESYQDNITDRFKFEEAGVFKVKATLKRNGEPIEYKYSHNIHIVEELSHELYNVNVNGYYDEESDTYAPHIKWMNTKSDAVFEVEIRTAHDWAVYRSSDIAYQDRFFSDGFKVPGDEFSLSDSFDFRIKSLISNRYTPFYYYQADSISSAHYDYLQDLDGISNFYINNMHDLAKLLNYIQLFKPSYLRQGEAYYADIYFAIDYDSDLKSFYERDGEIEGQYPTSPIKNNASKLIKAFFRVYDAAFSTTNIYIENEKPDGGVRIRLQPQDLQIEDISFAEHEFELVYDQNRTMSSTGRSEDVLPIDSVTKTLSVSTSTQLLVAAGWGFKPVPVSGSPAQEVYQAARAVLRQIIDDGMNDTQKALAIFDYLAVSVVYDRELYDDYMSGAKSSEELRGHPSFHLEGVFLEGVAVCDGISKAYALLCAMEDIPAIRVSGAAYDNDLNPVNHAWNMVMLNGGWRYIDATWGRKRLKDDSTVYITVNHNYFKPSSAFLSTHAHDGEIPLALEDKIYFYYKEYQPNLYFETQAEFESFAEGWSNLTQSVFFEFVIDFEVSNIRQYVESKIPAGIKYDIDVTDKVVIVGLIV
ncbi:MAG: transglutaminase domain-containing protein [Bacillota bacterium]|nr:transglutaminase domain-containing protein [Bacillota bacterium]HHU43000.1 hypothetical protein [Clostridiales bacterium]